ncbi:MAG TPA: Nif3-like dinuclear metal center hexameric protein [Nitrospirota bacterium]|nr:Nif3-like dinuclear metal center hexameric protein [Nitrospirota bacterium]
MPKATIKNIAGFLNKTLRVGKIKDASKNGLQVRSPKNGEIGAVGFAVDACIATFEKARKLGVDLLVVHHGIKWVPQKDRELAALREACLKENNMALYAAHLPLDLHEEYGNNMQLARLLGLGRLNKFGRYHGIKIGYAGTFGSAVKLADVAAQIGKQLRSTCLVFPFGKERIRSIGIVSGGGGSILPDAVREKLDCFLVGEADLALFNAAKDQRMNVIAAGHYATETVGVKALASLINKVFGVKTVFIEDTKDL